MLSITRTGLNVQSRTLSKLPLRPILQAQSVRFQSTNPQPAAPSSSNQSHSQTPENSTPPPPPQPKSKHKLVYREIWPPLLRVLAYASATYFSLQFAWQYLDGEEQRQLERDVRRQMEEEIRTEMKIKAEQSVLDSKKTVDQKNGKGWLSWATGR